MQSARNSYHLAFANELEPLINQGIVYKKIFDQPLETDVLGENFDYKGFLTSDILDNLKLNEKVDYYFCGPKAYLQHCYSLLKNKGVEEENLHFEFFGPTQDITE